MAFDFPSSPTTGQTYSVTGGPTYVYNGTAWQVLTPGNQFNRTVFTATAGQTTFTMNYVVGAIDVYRNGVKLAPADFTATNGTSIVLANGCTVGDTVEVISYPMITYTDAVKRTGDTMTGALAVPSLTVNSVPVLAGPAFRAHKSATNTISLNTPTKVIFDSEVFDTANCYSTSEARFTPNVAGYYYVTSTVDIYMSSGNGTYISAAVYKNGSSTAIGSNIATAISQNTSVSSSLIYMNGTTDYLEVYAFVFTTRGGNPVVNGGANTCFFTGFLARAA